jgi:probable selenium-dependent hydroxylase accessory protein YqeC
MNHEAELIAAFDLERYRFIHLIGGGGKTSLMLAAARALAGRGRRVLATTSTRIRRCEGEALRALLIVSDADELAAKTRAALARHNPVVLARTAEGEKLLGFPAEELEHLAAGKVADALLVEADGAAGRPLKAHAPWEPVIALSADLVIIMVGAWCLGQPLDGRTVHRAELFAERVVCARQEPLAARHVAAILFQERGYLAKVPHQADVMVAVTSRDGDDGGLVQALEAADAERRLQRVVLLDEAAVGLGPVGRTTDPAS